MEKVSNFYKRSKSFFRRNQKPIEIMLYSNFTRSRFLDYSGTHSPCIFAFNFRYTLFTLLPLTKQLLIVLLGRVENPRLGFALRSLLSLPSLRCRQLRHSLTKFRYAHLSANPLFTTCIFPRKLCTIRTFTISICF